MELNNLHLDLIFKHVRKTISDAPVNDPNELRLRLVAMFSDLNCRPVAFRKEFSESMIFIDDCPEAKQELCKLFESNPSSLFIEEESSFFPMENAHPTASINILNSILDQFQIGNDVYRVDIAAILLQLENLDTSALLSLLNNIFGKNVMISRQELWECLNSFFHKSRYSRLYYLFTLAKHSKKDRVTSDELTTILTLFFWMESTVYGSVNLVSPKSYQAIASECTKAMFADLFSSKHVSFSNCVDWLYIYGHRYLVPSSTIIPFEPTVVASALEIYSCLLSLVDHNSFSFSNIVSEMKLIMNSQPTSEDLLLFLMSVYRPTLGTNEYHYFRALLRVLLQDITSYKLLAVLFCIHLYLQPQSEVPSLVQTVRSANLTLPVLLDALSMLLQEVKIQSPKEIALVSEEKKDTSGILASLQQQLDVDESAFVGIFDKLKKGLTMGLKGQKLLDYWVSEPSLSYSSAVNTSTLLISHKSPLLTFKENEEFAVSPFISAVFSSKTAVGCTMNMLLHHEASVFSASSFSLVVLLELYSASTRLYLSDFSAFMKKLIPDQSDLIQPLFQFLSMHSLSVPRDTLFFFLVELMLADKPLNQAVTTFCEILQTVSQRINESIPALFLSFLRVQIQLLNELFSRFVLSSGTDIDNVLFSILHIISSSNYSGEENLINSFIQKKEDAKSFKSTLQLWIETDSIAIDMIILSSSQSIKDRISRWKRFLGVSLTNDESIVPFIVRHITEEKDRYVSCYELRNLWDRFLPIPYHRDELQQRVMLLTSLFNMLSKKRGDSQQPLVDVYEVAFFCSVCCYGDINELIRHFALISGSESTLDYKQLLNLLQLMVRFSLFVQTSSCPLPENAYDSTLSKFLETMHITPSQPVELRSVFHVILRNASLLLPYTESIKLPIAQSKITNKVAIWVKEFSSQFMRCIDDIEKTATNNSSSVIYFGDIICPLFAMTEISQDASDLLWEVCTSLWKAALFYSTAPSGSCHFVDWLRCVVSLFPSSETILRLSKVMHGEEDKWSYYELYDLVECMLRVNDYMFTLFQGNANILQSLAESITSSCFINFYKDPNSSLTSTSIASYLSLHPFISSQATDLPITSSPSLLLSRAYQTLTLNAIQPSMDNIASVVDVPKMTPLTLTPSQPPTKNTILDAIQVPEAETVIHFTEDAIPVPEAEAVIHVPDDVIQVPDDVIQVPDDAIQVPEAEVVMPVEGDVSIPPNPILEVPSAVPMRSPIVSPIPSPPKSPMPSPMVHESTPHMGPSAAAAMGNPSQFVFMSVPSLAQETVSESLLPTTPIPAAEIATAEVAAEEIPTAEIPAAEEIPTAEIATAEIATALPAPVPQTDDVPTAIPASVPQVPQVPQVSQVPQVPQASQVSQVPEAIPEAIPEAVPAMPVLSAMPVLTAMPTVPAVSTMPGVPGVPGVPGIPGMPGLANSVDASEQPLPPLPSMPSMPSMQPMQPMQQVQQVQQGSQLISMMSASIPTLDPKTGSLVVETSIPITPLSSVQSKPNSPGEKRNAEFYLTFPTDATVDVLQLYEKATEIGNSINRNDFGSMLGKENASNEAMIVQFARDVYDALDMWREEKVELKMLLSLLCLFEDKPLTERFENTLKIFFDHNETITKDEFLKLLRSMNQLLTEFVISAQPIDLVSLLETEIPAGTPLGVHDCVAFLTSGFSILNQNIGLYPLEINWQNETRNHTLSGLPLQKFINSKDNTYLTTLFPRLCDDKYITRSAFRSALSQWFVFLGVSLDGMIMHRYVDLLFELFRSDERLIHMGHVVAGLLYMLPKHDDDELVTLVNAATSLFELLAIFLKVKGLSLKKEYVLEMFISILRIDFSLRKCPMIRGEDTISNIRKYFEEETGEEITKNEFISIVCILYQEKLIPRIV